MQPTAKPDLTTFLASSAHDMKNSLGMLSGLLEKFLDVHSESDFSGYKDLASMLYETRRINNDLMHLLTLYKLDHKLYPFHPGCVSLADFFEDLQVQNASLLISRGIELAFRAEDDLIWYFDEDLILGVINHAVNNASNYTQNRILIAAEVVDGMLEIRVEDNGQGYPAFMLDNGHSPLGVDFNRGSTGLGLHFTRTVAALHKNKGRSGRLLLQNGGSLGGGVFIIQLP
jgi:signal transduction histidine kinase